MIASTPLLLIDAILVLLLAQLTAEVMSLVEASLYVPVAIRETLSPIDVEEGVEMLIDVSVALIALTVTVAAEEWPSRDAVMVAVPAALAVTMPELLTCAIEALELLQVEPEETSCVELSE